MSEHDVTKETIITPKPEPSPLARGERRGQQALPLDIPKPIQVEPSPVPQIEIPVVTGPALNLQEPELDSAGPWIKYIGIATLRIMDANAWKSGGVKSDKYIEWNALNNMRVPMKFFTLAELDYLINRDRRFIKVDN